MEKRITKAVGVSYFNKITEMVKELGGKKVSTKYVLNCVNLSYQKFFANSSNLLAREWLIHSKYHLLISILKDHSIVLDELRILSNISQQCNLYGISPSNCVLAKKYLNTLI